jgi:uncharacterized protein YqjF (DUF2071 family)
MRPFLTAEWRWLVILDFEADPALLAPLVPDGTVLDLWRGRALVSVVGFRFLETRLLGVAIPGHRDFDEVNLRLYVRRELDDGTVRRGVTFIRELVPRAAIALVARATYNEPYRALPMRSVAPGAATERPGRIQYSWRTSRGWSRVSATAVGSPEPIDPASQAGFVTEHYWGYTRQRDGRTVEYEVAHPRWRRWRAADALLEADLADTYGDEWVPVLSRPPVSALVADGSKVAVFAPHTLPGGAASHRSGE